MSREKEPSLLILFFVLPGDTPGRRILVVVQDLTRHRQLRERSARTISDTYLFIRSLLECCYLFL